MKTLICAALIFFLGVLSPQNFFAQTKRFDVSDLRKIARVSDPQISPDGKSIICVMSRANYDENRFEPELVLIDVATRAQKVLIAKRKNLASPRFSPDGNSLAFIANSEAGVPQIFVLQMSGGEARKITDAPKGVEQFVWKPDGKEIAFVAPDVADQRKGGERFNDSFEVGNNDYLVHESPLPSHLWLVSANGGEARRLTQGAWSVQQGAPPSASPISWSPDGKSLLFVRQSNAYSVGAETVVEILDAASGTMRQLTTNKNNESFAKYSPDGARILYALPRIESEAGVDNFDDIYVTSAGGKAINVTRQIDRQMRNAVWMPDSKSLLVAGHDETRTSLWTLSADDKQTARRLNLGEVSPVFASYFVDVSVAKTGAIAFVGTTARRSAEVYFMSSPDEAPQRLTNFQDDFSNSIELGATETIEWKTTDNLTSDGILVYPPNFSKEKKYPLVLVIHGGPANASVNSFQGFYVVAQLLAAHDFVVLMPNYRGTDNRGHLFQRARITGSGKDRRTDTGSAANDVMAGLKMIEKRPFVDSAKIGVSGWSWGGLLTSWLIGHEQIFKAAVSGAAVNDFLDQYNLSNFNAGWRDEFGGSPYVDENAAVYRAASPITYAKNIKTPTLIMAATGDTTVPITQSYSMFRALKDNGMTVKFIAYPSPQHFPSDPVRQADIYRRWVEWFDFYLK